MIRSKKMTTEEKYKDIHGFFVPDRIMDCKKDPLLLEKFKKEIEFIFTNESLYNDFIEICSEKKQPGKSNKTNSLIAYLVGLTDFPPDPNKDFKFSSSYKLTRVSPPDIDIDFEEREPIFEYLSEKYGEDHTAFISTYIECKAKKSVQMAFKIKDIKMGNMDADQTSKWFSKRVNNEDDFSVSIDQPEIKEYINRYREVFGLAEKINGVKTFIGKHAAGILVTDKTIDEYIPLMKKASSGLVSSEYDKDDIENIGLLKYDILKISTLGHIHKTIDMIREKTGEIIDIEKVPLNDDKVLNLYRERDTSGIFQMEKYTMVKTLQSVRVNSFSDIAACNALGRPGPISEGYPEEYGKRQRDHSLIQFYHPSLKEVLKDTFGLILYQEQVTKIAEILAGLTATQADKIRKFIGKKQTDEEKVKPIRNMFLNGCKRMGVVNDEFALRIWKIMEGFGSYAFNKAHSVEYAIVSYWTAYLKTYYFVYFMAVLMSTTLDDGQNETEENIEKYQKELRKKGYTVLSPDVNKSKQYFEVLDEKTIIEPFHVMKGIGKNVGNNISKFQPFLDFDDFLQKTSDQRIGSDVVETMLNNGYFNCFGKKDNFMDQYRIFFQKRKKDKSASSSIPRGPINVRVPVPGKKGNKILEERKYTQDDFL